MSKMKIEDLIQRIKTDDDFVKKLLSNTENFLKSEGYDIDEVEKTIDLPDMDAELTEPMGIRVILLKEIKAIIEGDF